ncbi:MAG: LysM peptidoglycan-binding domain-containing protein [Gammaproteobacteria bacterium]|nr:LysM peptidoglycan-binding domain-containing protein [Gammaproteobacteria bacterium]MDD9960214.1 LysM peptidoglycan-binding domain-containing protein [Gammaproteobacteria bacterium]
MSYSRNNPAMRIAFLCSLLVFLAACQSTVSPITESISSIPAAQSDEAAVIEQAINSPVLAIEEQDVIESFDNLWDRLQARFQLIEHYEHPAVEQQLSNYVNNQAYFDRISERAQPFLFWIVGEIERRELPMELALIPIVESTFNPNAYSPEHAVGLWQFIGPTARSFGLQQDWWYDGRRDPRASTIAALDYLEQLHKEFGKDWLLALAAYNTGQGNVNRAIRRAGLDIETANFWSLRLANETRSHVPKILALAKLVNDSAAYGVELTPIANEEPLVLVEVDSQIDLIQAARLAQLEYSELRRLNPGYLQWATHPDNPQVIAVPIKNAELLQTGISQLGPDQFVTWDRYEIQPGDTLGGIARKLGTRVDVLQTVNEISGSRIIAGDSLLVPRTTDLSLLANFNRGNQSARRILPTPNVYLVRNGDNLWTIARRFDLRSAEIAQWNNISLNSTLQPGQELNLEFALSETEAPSTVSATDGAEEYRVRRGDSMHVIANRFRIDLSDLLNWNEMQADELIFPGQLIQITPPDNNLN